MTKLQKLRKNRKRCFKCGTDCTFDHMTCGKILNRVWCHKCFDVTPCGKEQHGNDCSSWIMDGEQPGSDEFKPKKQSATAQAFDRSTVNDVMRRSKESFCPTDEALDRSAAMAVLKLENAHAALRAALAVMEATDYYENEMGESCSSCEAWLVKSRGYHHHSHCSRVAAIKLARAALGE